MLRRLVAAEPTPMLVLSAQGLILQASPAAIRLFASEALIGTALAAFCSKIELLPDLAALLQRPTAPLDLELRRGGGAIFLARLSAARLPLGAGIAVWLEDLTAMASGDGDWQRLREQSDRSAAAKAMFLATMSHEIRTPMNGMIGMLELLSQSGLSAEQREMVEVIQESGRTLLTITDEILDLSKIEAGKLTLDLVPFSLRQALEDMIELVAAKARKKGLELAWWTDPSLPDHFIGDPVRLKQIGLNLLSNAVKFTDRGSVILRLHGLGGEEDRPIVRFEVTDTGLGLTPQQQERLFQPFSQADHSAMRNFGGTGLGLSICHRLTALMQGEIGVVSAAGAGSTFWFEIPLAVDHRSAPFQPELEGVVALVMDDLPESRATIAAQLRFEGALVLEASDSLAAEELLEDSKRVDVAIVDAGDGLLVDVLVPLLQKMPMRAVLPILPGADDDIAAWCVAQGLAAPLQKPLRKKQLLRAVAVALGRPEPAEAPPAPSIEPILSESEAGGTSGPAILVAEDNAINRLVLTKQLRQLGFACDMAEHGEAAWAKLQAKRYDLLLTDCIMPVLDGYELARRIRRAEAQNQTERLRIVALTANVLEGEEDKCRRAGMDGYVSKPLTLDRLAALLRKIFHGEDHAAAPADKAAAEAGTGTDPIDWLALGAILGSADPADLHEVAGFFADSFAGLLDDLTSALDRRDAEDVVRAAHSAKGAARNGGAPILAGLMAEIEDSARKGEGCDSQLRRLAAARFEFARLRDWLDRR